MSLSQFLYSKKSDPVWGMFSIVTLFSVVLYLYYGIVFPVDFEVDPYQGKVVRLGSDAGDLREGESLVRIGDKEPRATLESRRNDIFNAFRQAEDGELVEVVVERGGKEVSLGIPKIVSLRLNPETVPVCIAALMFWFMATLAVVFLRPRGQPWIILVLCFFSASLWIASGLSSSLQVALSGHVYHVVTWIFLALFLHLHLILPVSFLKHQRMAPSVVYAGALLVAVLDFLFLIPLGSFYRLILVCILAAVGILVYRLSIDAPPAVKVANRLMAFGLILGLGPVFVSVFAMTKLFSGGLPAQSYWVTELFCLFLPIWPLTYIYAIYRHDMGVLSYRANRVFGVYGFLALFSVAYLVVFVLLKEYVEPGFGPEHFVTASALISLVFVLVAPFVRERFQVELDRRVFGIKYSPGEVVGMFAQRIPTAFNREILRSIIIEEILPTFLVRQSALYLLDSDDALLYTEGLEAGEEEVAPKAFLQSVENLGVYLPFEVNRDALNPWIRLVVPLKVQERQVGVWFFGNRDPDDYYPKDDIKILTSLANQIAPVIENFRLVEMARHEVEENKRLHRQLSHSQKMEAIGRFSAGIAHDFNNLLSVILGYSSLLLDKHGGDQELHRALKEVHGAGRRAADLTRQLLAFSRQGEMESKVVSLNEIIEDVAVMLRRMIGEDIKLEIKLDPEGGNVAVDPGQMGQVVVNLFVNGRDAMPDGGKLTIETKNYHHEKGRDLPHDGDLPAGNYVVLRVIDTGTGLALDVRQRIFEPFFTTKDKDKGTGLGLSIVYGFIKQSKGYIFVDSEQGKGTTFSIYLPVVHEEINWEESGASLRQISLSGSETILLVEDEDSVRGVAEEILVGQGYEVLPANCAAEGLEIADRHAGKIDLLLTDVVMPKMKGPELADRLLRRQPGIRVLFMSGYNEERIFSASNGRKVPMLLQKPFSPEKLARTVREALDENLPEVGFRAR